jgi:hypothetical protein
MPDTVVERHGVLAVLCDREGQSLLTDRDALDLIGLALEHGAELVVIPVERLDDRFFDLSSRLAGEIVQKFVNYRLRLVIVGDIGKHLEASSALRDFVRETNGGRQLWFLADLAVLDARLAGFRA